VDPDLGDRVVVGDVEQADVVTYVKLGPARQHPLDQSGQVSIDPSAVRNSPQQEQAGDQYGHTGGGLAVAGGAGERQQQRCQRRHDARAGQQHEGEHDAPSRWMGDDVFGFGRGEADTTEG
jgi:hypothetical protein